MVGFMQTHFADFHYLHTSARSPAAARGGDCNTHNKVVNWLSHSGDTASIPKQGIISHEAPQPPHV